MKDERLNLLSSSYFSTFIYSLSGIYFIFNLENKRVEEKKNSTQEYKRFFIIQVQLSHCLFSLFSIAWPCFHHYFNTNDFSYPMSIEQIFHSLSPYLFGSLVALGGAWIFYLLKIGNFQNLATEILHKAELDAEAVKRSNELDFQKRKIELKQEMEKIHYQNQQKNLSEENRLKKRKVFLEEQSNKIQKKLAEIEKHSISLEKTKKKLKEEQILLEQKNQSLFSKLESLSKLSSKEAKKLLLQQTEALIKIDTAKFIVKMNEEIEENTEKKAKQIIATAINRLAVSSTSELSISTVSLPNEEMKGRIIGKDGRNIRSLEMSTGVNFIIDETPCAVIVSSFDPIRKEIAKVALKELVADGRIHPTHIEDSVARAKDCVEKQIKEKGKQAAIQIGALDLHPKLISLLGKLYFRYSYGQNLLTHSLEVSHILGIMATELGLNVPIAKRIGLLHDIGKAISHETEGSHALIGYEIALKCGESAEVVNGIASHHNETPALSILASLCSSADAISASRPGARVEAVEEYIKRLEKLEKIALSFHGVKQVYAMQAGREIRVIVHPNKIGDEDTINLSRDIAKKVENNLQFSGKIKVTIIRERRAVEYAV